MKRIIILLVFSISMLIVVGCTKIIDKGLASDEVILENIKYKLDQDDSEYGIKYKVASNFRKTDMGNCINYYSEKINDQSYFVIRIFHYKNKTIDYAIKDTVEEYDKREEVKVNNIDYTKVHFINFTKADVYLYYHKHNNDVYAFVFTAGIDLTRLEDIFLNSIVYE